jgi:hypothetical protein
MGKNPDFTTKSNEKSSFGRVYGLSTLGSTKIKGSKLGPFYFGKSDKRGVEPGG